MTAVVGQGIALPVSPQPSWMKVATDADYLSIFSAAALTNQVPLFQLDKKCILHGIRIKHSVSFAGGGISAYTVSVGDISNAARFASAFDVFQAASPTAFELSDNFYMENDSVAVQIYATATSVGANLNQATQGLVSIWAMLSRIPS